MHLLLCRYRGEKLNRYVSSPKRRKAAKDVIISTVYDRPEEVKDSVPRTAPPTVLKHRQVKFLRGKQKLIPDSPAADS